MTATPKLHSHHHVQRKRRFRVRPQSLGIGFESFDVADFRVRNKTAEHNEVMPIPHPLQYLAGWINLVLWVLLLGFLVLNADIVLGFLWLFLGRHLASG
jgi:hypothetical protein